jgi:hypothetical protein
MLAQSFFIEIQNLSNNYFKKFLARLITRQKPGPGRAMLAQSFCITMENTSNIVSRDFWPS